MNASIMKRKFLVPAVSAAISGLAATAAGALLFACLWQARPYAYAEQ